MLAVPRHPAAGIAKPRMLTPRREQRPALLADPGITHQAMLRGANPAFPARDLMLAGYPIPIKP